jgi:16S rRNA (cytosine1402-N4)-methyltransferase
VHASFSALHLHLGGRRFHGILADLGVSSDQIAGQRGFSFNDAAPLDMRMDRSQPKSAREIVNDSSERELFIILRKGGVGEAAKAVAREIVRARPIYDTPSLAEAVAKAMHGRLAHKRVNPATVAFQAIRMAVNDELEEIAALLDLAPGIAQRPGRLAVITFHSIEDKAVTSRMRAWEGADDLPALWPGAVPKRALGRMVVRKAITPGAAELERNPRARSAKLRVFGFC